MGWGKGWRVSVAKAMYEHGLASERAAIILRDEHGAGHEPGTRCDICPLCQDEQKQAKRYAERKPSP